MTFKNSSEEFIFRRKIITLRVWQSRIYMWLLSTVIAGRREIYGGTERFSLWISILERYAIISTTLFHSIPSRFHYTKLSRTE